MIARVWRGWTTQGLADTYEGLLKTEIFPGIFAKQIEGFLRIELFRREAATETEFMTVMWCASQEAVTAFVGQNHSVAYVPDSARRVLARFDEHSCHYEVRASQDASMPDQKFVGACRRTSNRSAR